jgi:hypothetical protein
MTAIEQASADIEQRVVVLNARGVQLVQADDFVDRQLGRPTHSRVGPAANQVDWETTVR